MRVVRDWWIEASWAACGVFATGAVWYFLSAREYYWAVLCSVAGLSFAILAIHLHRSKDALADQPQGPPTEQDKLVTLRWWESSGLRTEYERRGFNHFYWSNPEAIAERWQQGYETVWEDDAPANARYPIVNKSGQVLLAKRDA
jgi:hypothetical protein